MTGCTKATAGCDHCYAATIAASKTRDIYLRQLPVRNTVKARADPFAPRFWPQRLDQPLHWREPRRVFVNSMSDVFHAHVTLEMIQRVFDVMNRAPWHQVQVLTKRPERALRFASQLSWTDNIWMGTSIENMDVAKRADAVRKIPARVRFISAEPLLGPLDDLDLTDIHWVIGGGESGVGHRPCLPVWATGLRDLCAETKVAFFWKQWGGHTPKSGGRDLEGNEWNQYPTSSVGARHYACHPDAVIACSGKNRGRLGAVLVGIIRKRSIRSARRFDVRAKIIYHVESAVLYTDRCTAATAAAAPSERSINHF